MSKWRGPKYFLKQLKKQNITSKKVEAILNRKFNSYYDDELFLRMWDKTIKRGECWVYFGFLDKDGYGMISYHDNSARVHRLSAYLFLGFDLKNDKQINHKSICKSKACWNPDHIYIGTHSENMLDSVADGTHINTQKTHCTCGREYDKIIIYNGRIWRRCSACIKMNDYMKSLKKKYKIRTIRKR